MVAIHVSTARTSSRVLLGSAELPNLIPLGPMDALRRSDYCFCHRRDRQGSVNTAVRLVVDVRMLLHNFISFRF